MLGLLEQWTAQIFAHNLLGAFNFPYLPQYEVVSDGCTTIVVRYYILPDGTRIYDDPIVTQNPNCPPPNELPPPPPPTDEPTYPQLECQGDILILRIPTHTEFHREHSPLEPSDQSTKITARLLSVNFPQENEDGLKIGTFTVDWNLSGWRVTAPSQIEFFYGLNLYKEEFSVTKTITYTVDRSRSGDGEGYNKRTRANTGDSYKHDYFTQGISGIIPLELWAYLGFFANTFYNADFKNSSNTNFYTGETRPGSNFNSRDPQYTYNDYSDENQTLYTINAYFTKCFSSPINYYPHTPPPPEPPMTCCPQNDHLLRLILRNLGRFPAQVPSNLTDENPQPITIRSLAELTSWQTLQMDSLAGQFPLKIKIEDTDLTQSGNQTQEIIIPNLAEGLAEIIGLAILLKRESGVNLETGIKTLIEAGQAKQAATVAADVGLANAEYLGYSLKKINRAIKFTFSPLKTKFDEFLKPQSQKYATYENEDKTTLSDYLHPLLSMAANWSAQNFRRIPKDPIAGKDAIKKYIAKDETTKQEAQRTYNDEWSDWREEVEDGYTNDPLYPDAQERQPYGRDRSQRPKIRKLGEPQ